MAVIGSVYASLYVSSLSDSAVVQALPSEVRDIAGESVGQAVVVSEQIRAGGDSGLAQSVTDAANSAFLDGLAAGSYVAAGVTAVGAVVAAIFLPSRPRTAPDRAAHRAKVTTV
ncbi:hypothetical protein [Rhodococcus sp. NBC_00297]|uniref:hypothetical protein n=1 Tax=Rhodococcus sp. NBC_00297 TaxID=2976005 RepID=UPI002E28ACFF|nr:hypothetical protein [Rhodococcus sp. NBC_00297]